MDRRIILKFRWYAQSGMRWLGWSGMVGLGGLALCLMFYVFTLQPEKVKLGEMQAQITLLNKQFSQKKVAQVQVKGPEDQLSDFYRFFPSTQIAPDLLGKLFDAAASTGIALQQGQYRMIAAKGDKLGRYQITLPAKGTYPQLRKFIAQLLTDLPTIALDSIHLQRQKVGDPQLDAQIKLTLFMGAV